MNDHRDSDGAHDSDDNVIRLLRLAGTRLPVPATRTARVRRTVHAEWQAVVRRRTARRHLFFPAIAFAVITLLILAGGTWSLVERTAPVSGEPVAVVEQLDGVPRRASGTFEVPGPTGLSLRDTIRVGDWIETDLRSRVALRFSDGTSVRLDVGSRGRAVAPNAVELSAGAVYVDTGRESARFEVRTAMATARDIGTQFEVRILDRTVRLRVRTGVVELADRVRSVTGRRGTEITLSAAGAVSRAIAPHSTDWDWTARVSPPMDIEGAALSDFVARVGRELGWVVHYADPALAQEATGITLHGSVKGLSPREALEVAIATSGLEHRVEDGSLVVFRTTDTPQGPAR